MSDTDLVRHALTAARDAAYPLIQAPGVAAAQRTVRRRRTRRTVTLTVFVLLALASGTVAAWPTPMATAPGTRPGLSASPSCVAAPVPTISNGDLSDQDRPLVSLSHGGGARYCPGEVYRITWVAYMYQPDGGQRLYLSGETLMSGAGGGIATPQVPWRRGGCWGDLYYLLGDGVPPQSIPPGEHWHYEPWTPGAAAGVFEHHFQLTNPICE